MTDIERKEIINYDKGKFLEYLEKDNSGQIVELLNETGINYLKEYKYIEDRICYILTFSKYKNELLKQPLFLETLLKTDIRRYYASLSELKDDTYETIIKKCHELNISSENIARIITYFNFEYQKKLLDNYALSIDILYELLNQNPEKLGPIIINKNKINLLSDNVNIEKLIGAGKELIIKSLRNKNLQQTNSYNINTFYLSKDVLSYEFAKKYWNNFDVFRYRSLVNNAEYCGDISKLNKYAKEKEEKYINLLELPEPYFSIYKLGCELANINEYGTQYYKISKELKILINKLDRQVAKEIYENWNNKYSKNTDLLKEYLIINFEKEISNYIIDYHFEENYYNIMYDLRELLNFYYSGNINLSQEKLNIYQKISEIDTLTHEEKKELHNELKKYNMIEMFYDDMSLARKIVHEAIKDYSLTQEEMEKYKNENLSEKYGIDVYSIEDNPFFAIVKAGRHITDILPTGHSYSLVGNGCISTFGNVSDSSTFVYSSEELNPDQIVHVYPMDSYTLFKPFELYENATDRVHPLLMPDELLKETKGYHYTELVILEQGKKTMEINKNIKELKKIALYCLDNITDRDISIAKSSNVGIFLINTKKYNKGEELPPSIYRHQNIENIDYDNYNYFDGITRIEQHKKNR